MALQEALRYYDWACKFTIPGSNDCDVTYFAVPFYESYTMLNISNVRAALSPRNTPQYIHSVLFYVLLA